LPFALLLALGLVLAVEVRLLGWVAVLPVAPAVGEAVPDGMREAGTAEIGAGTG